MPVKPADTDHRRGQGQDLWISGEDRCLLQPAGGNSEGVCVGERVPRLDASGFENQGFTSRYDVDR
jgi:hypothetical protein